MCEIKPIMPNLPCQTYQAEPTKTNFRKNKPKTKSVTGYISHCLDPSCLWECLLSSSNFRTQILWLQTGSKPYPVFSVHSIFSHLCKCPLIHFPGLAIATVLLLLAIILQDTKGLFRGSKQDSQFLLIETDDEKIETDGEKFETDDEKNETDDETIEEEAGEDYNDSGESGDNRYGSECSSLGTVSNNQLPL